MQHKETWLTFPPHLDPPSTRSLSLLFILTEVRNLFEQIKKFTGKIELDASSLFDCAEFNHFFSLGFAFPQNGIFPDKLCFYCDILLQASKIEANTLMKELDEMRIAILHFRTNLIASKKNSVFSMQTSKITLDFLHSFHNKIRSFFSALIPYLNEARTDENVLLRLIEQRETLNYHLGTHYIEHILQKFFPSGHAHLRAIICEGFTRRGFTSFLSEKEHLIEEIEWENPCLVTHD